MTQTLFLQSGPFLPFVAFVIAFATVCWIHPKLVKLALLKSIVDNPDARKLQRTPVPVLGGTAVFLGLTLGLGCTSPFYDSTYLPIILMLLTLMLYTGTIDDIMNLSPRLRFVIEIACILLMFGNGHGIDNFHGLWGIYEIPTTLAMCLTVFACVGIINAINLIDGVDGLSSGFGIISSLFFGILFHRADDLPFVVMAACCAGALIPFFLHNVFGRNSKMFIGDGGTLVMGMVMSVFVMRMLGKNSPCDSLSSTGIGLIPFTLAVLSIPVFDTVRVMSARIVRGQSPFQPDKTHLHHLFIGIGFSHAGTATCILLLNTIVVIVWALLCQAGVSVEVQLYSVLALGFLFTFVLYPRVKSLSRDGMAYRLLRRMAVLSHIEHKGAFLWLQRTMDKL